MTLYAFCLWKECIGVWTGSQRCADLISFCFLLFAFCSLYFVLEPYSIIFEHVVVKSSRSSWLVPIYALCRSLFSSGLILVTWPLSYLLWVLYLFSRQTPCIHLDILRIFSKTITAVKFHFSRLSTYLSPCHKTKSAVGFPSNHPSAPQHLLSLNPLSAQIKPMIDIYVLSLLSISFRLTETQSRVLLGRFPNNTVSSPTFDTQPIRMHHGICIMSILTPWWFLGLESKADL